MNTKIIFTIAWATLIISPPFVLILTDLGFIDKNITSHLPFLTFPAGLYLTIVPIVHTVIEKIDEGNPPSIHEMFNNALKAVAGVSLLAFSLTIVT